MDDHPIDWMSAYLDHELNSNDREQMELHLAQCDSCQLLLTELLDMQGQLAQFYHELEAPEGLENRIMQAVEGRGANFTKVGSVILPLVGIAALVVLFSTYGSILFKLLAVSFNFAVTAAYVVSRVASSIPVLWVSMLALAIGLSLVSGLSIRRLLRSSTQ